MSDPKGERPDNPETPDGTAGEGDDEVTAASAEPADAPDPADPGDEQQAAASAAESGEASREGDTPQDDAARGDAPAVDEEPATAAAPHDEDADTSRAVDGPDEDASDEDVDTTEPPSSETPVETPPVSGGRTPDTADENPAGDAGALASAEPEAAPGAESESTPSATEPTPEPTPDGSAGAAPSGWRRLGAALLPRASRSQVLAGVLCAALGFALVVQVQQSASDQLSSARQEDLVRLLDEVTDRAQQLGDEVSGLEATRDELESGSGQARSALELAEQRAESEGILSGRLPAQGPGVRVTIQDPAGALKASQMFNVLEELRNAGAEVVELNGVRLVTSTWFEDEGDGIVVDGTKLSSPYEWTVIGDPETMDRALEIPGGALATVRTAGAEASTAREDEVKITAVTPPQEPEYAQPEREHD